MSKILIAKETLIVIVLIVIIISSAVSAGVSVLVVNSESSKGTDGARGATGATGSQGPRGDTGPTGATGATGATGSQGPQGGTGATGSSGTTGAAGTNGASWLSGTGAPNANLGVNNDYYLDTSNSDIYNKISGAWTKVSNIRGTTGLTGAKGDVGATGVQGRPGATVNSFTNIGYVSNLNFGGNNIGSITITAPTNGVVHVTLTGYVQMYNNNTCLFAIGSAPMDIDLDLMYVGVTTPSATSQQTMYSMSSQAVVSVTAGTTYTFYATAYRGSDDTATMTLNSVKMTAEFSEK